MKAEEFFVAADAVPAETEVVRTPFGPVTVRGLTGAEYDRYEAATVVRPPKGAPDDADPTFRADRGLLMRLGAVEPAFTDADLPRLRSLPAKVLKPVAEAVVRLSGATADGQESIAGN